jgi:peptide/nickel transport system permease protein
VDAVLRYLVRRLLGSIPVLLAARNSRFLVPQERKALGLDHPIVVQWWDWLKGFLHGDMGTSSRTGDPVSTMIGRALWPTLQLMFWATILSITLAVLLGVYSAVKQYSVGDYAFTGLSYLGIAMPDFWLSLILIGLFVTEPRNLFHLNQPIFYSIGLHTEGVKGLNLDYFRHLALPVIALTFTSIASWSRFQRASMLEVLNSDYVRTARAKGVPQRTVIRKHALRNALIPFVTVTALDTAALITGVIIIEEIFSISGMGQGFITALGAGDAPFLLAWFFCGAIAVIAFNLFADFMYVVLDPRIRLS